MISKDELLKWVTDLEDGSYVAIDEGGLQLHVLDEDSVQPTEAYIEVGGYPEDDLPDDVAAIARKCQWARACQKRCEATAQPIKAGELSEFLDATDDIVALLAELAKSGYTENAQVFLSKL